MQNSNIANNNVERSSHDCDVLMSSLNDISSNVRSSTDHNAVVSPDNQNQGVNNSNGRRSYASAAAGSDNDPSLNPPPFCTKNLTRADYVNSIFCLLGTDAKRHVKCIHMGPIGYSCRVTFKDNAPCHQETLLAKGIHLRNTFLFFQEAQKSSLSVFSKYGTIP